MAESSVLVPHVRPVATVFVNWSNRFFLLICESIHNVVIAINLRISYWLLTSAFCSTCRFWPVRWTCSRRSSIKPARRSTAARTRSTARVPRWRLKHSASCWWPVSPSRRVLLYFPNPSPAALEGIDKDQATQFILRWASLSHQLQQQWDTCSQTCKNSCFKILYVIFVVASVSLRNTTKYYKVWENCEPNCLKPFTTQFIMEHELHIFLFIAYHYILCMLCIKYCVFMIYLLIIVTWFSVQTLHNEMATLLNTIIGHAHIVLLWLVNGTM